MSRVTLLTVAGVPLRMSPLFVAVASVIGWRAGQDVANARFAETPVVPEDWRELSAWLETYDPADIVVTQPSTGWVIAAALGVALVYALSVIAHELGHFLAARALDIEVTAVELDAAGGYVEMHDDDRLTAVKRATIIAAGPLVTALLALGTFIALRVLGLPLADMPHLQSGAGVAAGHILASAFWINLIALAVNLLPLRSLDGGQLLSAARPSFKPRISRRRA
jgi:membrane-associated protease RseP (regulator of RpoE activity)